MTSKDRNNFRQRKEWKEFSAGLRAERGSRCELCGILKKKGLHCHHLNPKEYTTLVASDFSVLCSSCHEIVERFEIRRRGKKAATILHLDEWMLLLSPFLPRS